MPSRIIQTLFRSSSNSLSGMISTAKKDMFPDHGFDQFFLQLHSLSEDFTDRLLNIIENIVVSVPSIVKERITH